MQDIVHAIVCIICVIHAYICIYGVGMYELMLRSVSDVAKYVTQRRKLLKLKQSDFKLLSGMTQQQLSKFERHNVDISLSSFFALAESLKLDVVVIPRELRQPMQRSMVSSDSDSTSTLASDMVAHLSDDDDDH